MKKCSMKDLYLIVKGRLQAATSSQKAQAKELSEQSIARPETSLLGVDVGSQFVGFSYAPKPFRHFSHPLTTLERGDDHADQVHKLTERIKPVGLVIGEPIMHENTMKVVQDYIEILKKIKSCENLFYAMTNECGSTQLARFMISNVGHHYHYDWNGDYLNWKKRLNAFSATVILRTGIDEAEKSCCEITEPTICLHDLYLLIRSSVFLTPFFSIHVEKNSLRVTSPTSIKDVYQCAIGNFGVPQYGGTMTGVVMHPKANQKACKSFDDVDVSFKSKPGSMPVFVLVYRGGKIPMFLVRLIVCIEVVFDSLSFRNCGKCVACNYMLAHMKMMII